jgi:hypothetical protein
VHRSRPGAAAPWHTSPARPGGGRRSARDVWVRRPSGLALRLQSPINQAPEGPGLPRNLRMPAAREKHPFSTDRLDQSLVHAKPSLDRCGKPGSSVWIAHCHFAFTPKFYKKSDSFGRLAPLFWLTTQSDSGRRNIRWRLSLLLQQQQRGTTMRITRIALATAFALYSTFALAQAGGGAGGAAGGSAAGSSGSSAGAGTGGSSGTTISGAGSSTGSTAGSASGPGSTTNPSGSTIGAGSSPSGSTVTPTGPGSGTGR